MRALAQAWQRGDLRGHQTARRITDVVEADRNQVQPQKSRPRRLIGRTFFRLMKVTIPSAGARPVCPGGRQGVMDHVGRLTRALVAEGATDPRPGPNVPDVLGEGADVTRRPDP